MGRNGAYLREARSAEKRADREKSDAGRAAWLLIARGWRGLSAAPEARQLQMASMEMASIEMASMQMPSMEMAQMAPRRSRANRPKGIRERRSGARKL
jgi:hypothetical protein